jgi:hypothetical protein
MSAIEKSSVSSDPAVVFDYNSLAVHTLQADRDVRTLEIVVLRVKGDVLAHGYVIANDDQSAGSNI